ncbi:hypothetical protein SY89_01769 [Halolamina pelagica]|uniref:Uncharacterized protein n=1 Tax=Halolamina pelagica TaxID=699431 RepID=A0A0N8I013_9EURY|nr:hypothetical protein [Halolamina pelagica]KPN31027.1 hypothetical protein SY89_01769 [Halolamina pelagica]
MTDRIDLDDVEQPDEERDADQPNPGDWLWRGEGSPDEEPDAPERSVDIGADDFEAADAATPGSPARTTTDRSASPSRAAAPVGRRRVRVAVRPAASPERRR